MLVHGLMSEPGTWLVMLNDLLGDPVLRERYQLWACLYPTGNPILFSAHLLREALFDAQKSFDPNREDPAFNEMEAKLLGIGHKVVNPTRLFKGDQTRRKEEYLRQDISSILDGVDGVVLLSGWQKSKGAQVEVLVALALGLRIFTFWVHKHKITTDSLTQDVTEQVRKHIFVRCLDAPRSYI